MSGSLLETARLLIRPATADDTEALHAGYADEAAMRYWSHAAHTTVGETRTRLQHNIAEPGWRLWAITLAGGYHAIGTVAAGEKRQAGVTEIGYSLLRPYWRQGYAREALTAVIDHLFRVDGYRRVFADIDPENAASRRLVEKLGFRLEGVLRAEWETHIGVRDACIYGLLAGEWGLNGGGNGAASS